MKVTVFIVFVFCCFAYGSNAYARGGHNHSHGRAPHFMNRILPSYRSNSKPVEYVSRFTTPIYHYKEHPLPHIYSVDKPLIDDPRIYRRLNFHKQYHSDFYRFDEKKNQYSVPNSLHADGLGINQRRIQVEIDGKTLYYSDGLFYQESGKHIVVVPPPIEAVVKIRPENDLNLRGESYEHNGIYYRRVIEGYQVVPQPL